jgi:hypothetical protein
MHCNAFLLLCVSASLAGPSDTRPPIPGADHLRPWHVSRDPHLGIGTESGRGIGRRDL